MPTPSARRRVVLDTDTFNEVDDQFALAHLLLSPDQVGLEAVYAAPFLNERSAGPADGMEKSFEEIGRVLALVPTPAPPAVFRGSPAFLEGPGLPVRSPAALDLVERAMSGPGTLHVAAIAAPTNVASAILIEPRIAGRIEVAWLGGHALYWPTAREFNLKQDLHAARVLFESGVPLVHLPCNPVASHLVVTVPELREHLAPHSRLGAYLTDIVARYGEGKPPGWSKVIWDIAASARMVDPAWVPVDEVPAPSLTDDLAWKRGKGHAMRTATSVNRNAIFGDFFAKAKASES